MKPPTMIRFLTAFLSAIIMWVGLSLNPAKAGPSIAFDVSTGRITDADDIFRRWSPASLTKMMTAYVTFKALQAGELTLNSPVRMTLEAANQPPSKMGYSVGRIMTVDNALKFVIIKSANDVAQALAEAVAGSREAFVTRMNAEAKRLGMTQTNFVNPHGLHDPDQYTTARDLALLVRAIRAEFSVHAGYFAAEAIETNGTITPSYNLLLGRYAGADGMKTGFVCASGFNLAASATRGTKTVAAIVLGAENQKVRAEKAADLLENAFSKLENGSDLPALNTLEPDTGQQATPVADLTDTVCTDEARQARWDGRQVEGFMEFATRVIGTMERDPVALRAGLGGASGQSASAVQLGDVWVRALPVPAPKPKRPTLLENGDMEKYGLRPGFDVPIPSGRPEGIPESNQG